MDRKSEFVKKYSNLPLGLRDEIIVMLGDRPLTWNAAYVEIINDTDYSKEILDKLARLGLIK